MDDETTKTRIKLYHICSQYKASEVCFLTSKTLTYTEQTKTKKEERKENI